MNQKFIFGSLVLILVVLAGCAKVQPQECKQDDDCQATCNEPGCYNKDYIRINDLQDCEQKITHTCKCMDNVCTKI